MDPSPPHPFFDVCVIGAGLSGLSCVRTLVSKSRSRSRGAEKEEGNGGGKEPREGFDGGGGADERESGGRGGGGKRVGGRETLKRVLVLEASSRIGGRMRHMDGLAPWPVELGAEFIHGASHSSFKRFLDGEDEYADVALLSVENENSEDETKREERRNVRFPTEERQFPDHYFFQSSEPNRNNSNNNNNNYNNNNHFRKSENRLLSAEEVEDDADVALVHSWFASLKEESQDTLSSHLLSKLSLGGAAVSADMSVREFLRRVKGATERQLAIAEAIYSNDFGCDLSSLGLRESVEEAAHWCHGDEYFILTSHSFADVAAEMWSEDIRRHCSAVRERRGKRRVLREGEKGSEWHVWESKETEREGEKEGESGRVSVTLLLDTPVSCVDQSLSLAPHSGDEKGDVERRLVKLHCEETGESFLCGRVVITVPLPILREPSLLRFIPPLPREKLTAAKTISMGNALKIILCFSHQFWPSHVFDVVCPNSIIPEVWFTQRDVRKNKEREGERTSIGRRRERTGVVPNSEIPHAHERQKERVWVDCSSETSEGMSSAAGEDDKNADESNDPAAASFSPLRAADFLFAGAAALEDSLSPPSSSPPPLGNFVAVGFIAGEKANALLRERSTEDVVRSFIRQLDEMFEHCKNDYNDDKNDNIGCCRCCCCERRRRTSPDLVCPSDDASGMKSSARQQRGSEESSGPRTFPHCPSSPPLSPLPTLCCWPLSPTASNEHSCCCVRPSTSITSSFPLLLTWRSGALTVCATDVNATAAQRMRLIGSRGAVPPWRGCCCCSRMENRNDDWECKLHASGCSAGSMKKTVSSRPLSSFHSAGRKRHIGEENMEEQQREGQDEEKQDEVAHKLCSPLRKINLLPASSSFTGAVIVDWSQEPFTLGAYTHPSLGAQGLRKELARPLLDAEGTARVLFAGEATHCGVNPCLQAAMDTGKDVAEQIWNSWEQEESREDEGEGDGWRFGYVNKGKGKILLHSRL